MITYHVGPTLIPPTMLLVESETDDDGMDRSIDLVVLILVLVPALVRPDRRKKKTHNHIVSSYNR